MISDLLEFIDIDETTKKHGPEIWRVVDPHVDTIMANFYRRVNAFAITSRLSDITIRRLITKQKEHWAVLFDSRFDADYANGVRRIGIQHRDVSLSPMWYVLGYMILKIAFTDVIADTPLPPLQKGRLIKALDKYIAFDMAVALSTYDAAVVD